MTSYVPAWRRRTEGESRWPVTITIVVAIALQLALPEYLVLQSRWLLPSLEPRRAGRARPRPSPSCW